MPRHPRGFDLGQGLAHLQRHDRRLARWIRRVGPLDAPPGWRRPFDPVDALARAIMFQQLSGKAAATIVGRVETAIGSQRLHAATLARIDDAGLRACGVSGNKALALRDLARRELAGDIPSTRQMAWMHHEAIVEALLPIRGIGRWTVEMMLMFRLGRPDILPVDDLGVRKGAQRVDGGAGLPTPRELQARGQCWGPYRTLASLYLWRIADMADGGADTNRSQD
ncbi:DNA-3-methyladenine glycosylase 2 family protein [Stenotrophomonas acidaminiphila]|uniref:DNA-3-methyladenine glycosylase family protein n=1 Tax=Stenotrophomonas TaxID=40323 RepID=UPI001355F5CC|nr:DNA-3-methyladenine glycosylase [Stenotrophomonas sp.]MTI72401.1 DNA-3-methyladenine glycosylase 2 family protein [Stenotrophomonas sp.]NCT86314.1 DNA-3-methyladenine glycosylase 2 family protein [Stenotrophomonas acidaminiphila]